MDLCVSSNTLLHFLFVIHTRRHDLYVDRQALDILIQFIVEFMMSKSFVVANDDEL